MTVAPSLLECGRISHNPNDVAGRYCGHDKPILDGERFPHARIVHRECFDTRASVGRVIANTSRCPPFLSIREANTGTDSATRQESIR